jgi:hypothetical protein
MRATRLLALVPLLLAASAAFAQAQWAEFTDKADRFTIAFPAAPRVENFTYVTEYVSHVPAHRYVASDGATRYTLTVVDMTTTERKPASHGIEMRGAIQFAATALRRTGVVTADNYAEAWGVPGQVLQISLPNNARVYAHIYFVNKHLYILEAVAPAGAPPLAFFTALTFLDANGNPLSFVDNNYSFPESGPLLRGAPGTPGTVDPSGGGQASPP